MTRRRAAALAERRRPLAAVVALLLLVCLAPSAVRAADLPTADRELALRELRRALELAPESRYVRLWLAEAILDHAPDRRAEAVPLVEGVAASTPRPTHLVEDARLVQEARRRLADERRGRK